MDPSDGWGGAGGVEYPASYMVPSSWIELWPVRSALSEEYLVLSLDSTNLSVHNGSNAW